VAPEQLGDAPLTGAADVYALGLIVYELLAERRPFEGETSADRALARLVEPATPLPSDVPSPLRDLVHAMLAREPNDRPSAAEVEAAILPRIVGVSTGDVVGARSSRRPMPPPGRHDVGALPGSLGVRLAVARQRLSVVGEERDAIAVCDEVLSVVPDLDVALSVRALALVRKWNLVDFAADQATTASLAAQALGRALERAPHLADTHVADALVADYSGDVAYAVRALHRALALDPMHAFSHEVLGRIEIEAFAGATSRLHLVHALDKRRVGALTLIARELFFQGKVDDALRILDDLDRERSATNESIALRSRIAMWTRDAAACARAIERTEGSKSRVAHFMARAMRLVSSGGSFEELTSLGVALSRSSTTPKRKAFLLQLLAETATLVGQPVAERLVLSAANLPLTDLRWLDACPALAPLRDTSNFRLARSAVADRLERAFPGVSTGALTP
jgi:tetratricopeptide (TPR) repeat protein